MADSILIIGGEPDFQERLRFSLTEAGSEVTLAYNYISAKMIIEDFVPDIIILDEVHQNDIDSFAACRHLHDDYGIPIILLGEDSSDEAWERVKEAEADLYLLKLVRYRELTARVKAILRRFHQNGDSRWRKREVEDMKGLTAIEILIVVAIIILLAVVVVPRLLEIIGG